MSQTEPVMTDPSPTMRCIRCGYDLRGQPAEGCCPECGMSVAQTAAAGTDLQLGRPGWLLRLCLGCWLLLFSVLAAIGALPSAAALDSHIETRWLIGFLPLAAAIPCCGGLLLLTSREHRFEYQMRGNSLRVALRISMICPLIIAGCIRWLIEPPVNPRMANGGVRHIAQSGNPHLPEDVAKASALLIVPCSILTFLYLRTLARRINHASLAEHCVIVAVGVSAATVMMEIFAWCDIDNMAFVLTAFLLMFLFGIWSLYHFMRFAIQFGKAMRIARENWKNADAAMGGGEIPRV